MTDRILMSKQLKDPNFLGSHDLVKGVDGDNPVYGEMTLTIADVTLEKVNDMELIKTGKRNADGNQTKEAWVLHFAEKVKPYIIKAACVIAAVERATGTKVVNKWIGKKITFYVETGVYMPGTKKADNITTDALRVRPYPPVAAKLYVCADCGNDKVPENMAMRTEKAFGRILCKDCGVKACEQNTKAEADSNNETSA